MQMSTEQWKDVSFKQKRLRVNYGTGATTPDLCVTPPI